MGRCGRDERGPPVRGGRTGYRGAAGRVANGVNTVHVSPVREKTGDAPIGARQWIAREQLQDPRFGVPNVHPSALPKYRGPSPVPWAIRNGDPFMGITVHRKTCP